MKSPNSTRTRYRVPFGFFFVTSAQCGETALRC